MTTTGTLASSRDATEIDSATLTNSGVISSRNALRLQQTGSIKNSGEIATGSFDINAARLTNNGTLLQTGLGALAVKTAQLVNSQGGIIGQDLYASDSKPPSVTPSKTPPTTANNGSSVGTDDNSQPSQPNPAPLPIITRDGKINVNTLTNTGSIYTNSDINVSADSVVNQGKSSLAVSTLDIIDNGSAINNASRLQLDSIDWQLASFDNSKGQVIATDTISITSADQIINNQGRIAAVNDIKLTAQNDLDNTQGVVESNGMITTQSAALDNNQGLVSSKGDVTLDAKDNLNNTKGRLQSDQSVVISAKGYNNTDGTIIGVQRADIEVFDDITINSSNNDIQGATLALTSQGRIINSSKLAAQNALTISANSIDNTLGGELISNGTTELSAKTDIDNRGLINGANTYLNAINSINNHSNGRIYGDQVAIAVTTLNNTPDITTNANTSDSSSAPVIAARNRLDIGVKTLNNNPNQMRAGTFNTDFNGQAQLISNGELHIGGSLDTNHQAIGRATTVTNKGASIESVGDMTISTDLLNNVNADFRKEAFTISEAQDKNQYAGTEDGRKYDRDEVGFRDDKKLDDEDLYIIATNQPLGEKGGEDFWIFNFDERITEDRTVVSDPSRIISGGMITLQGNALNNDKSQLGLGEGFVVTGDKFTNVGASDLQGFKTKYIENGQVIYRHVESSGLFGSDHKIERDDKGPYVQAPEKIATYQLPTLKQDIDKVVIAHEVSGTDEQQIEKETTDEIRSSGNKATLPSSSLYGTNPDSSADYLIETDPAFANYKDWLTSDYMLERLQFDPNITQKRLGDGFYEQQYIRDQIMMLTGRYYLANYADQDTQYKGLMDAGITAAQTLNLRPGIALSAAQVANLTTDMVWLVEQSITLPDGSSQNVLVPKVYTRQAASQIDGTGNLIAANNVDIKVANDLNSQSNIVGHQSVKINANNITNANGGVVKGDFVQLATDNDLNNLSGTIAANSAMQLDVGGDLNNKSLTYTSDAVDGASNATRTGITQVASIYVGDNLKGKTDANGNPLTTFVANVGGDTSFAAGRLDNQGGSSLINTTGDVNLDAVNIGYQSNSILDDNNYYKQGGSADIGSQINSNNDILLTGNNISGTATTINSTNGGVGIVADGSVNFVEGRRKDTLSTAVRTVDKGTFSTTKTQDRFDSQSDESITSNIEGNTVTIKAGQDIGLTGTNVVSNDGTQLNADGDIDILASQNTSSERSSSQTKKSGLFGADGGIGFTIGKQKTDDSNTKTALTHTASKVGAIDGNVIITAGGTYQQTGSNIVAGMGADSDKYITDPDRGNTVVRAQQINIDSVTDIKTNQNETKFKQSGLTVSVSNSLVDNAKSIDSLIDASGNTDSTRMKGMAGVAAGLKTKALAKQGSDVLSMLQEGGKLQDIGSTRIQATIGSSKSESNSSIYTEVNQGSSITTNNLALIATGAGTDSNIDINGSSLTVNKDALFQADNDLNINGVAQNSNTRSDNKSSSTAIGAYAATNPGKGASYGITANASRAKGYANSDSTTYANSQVNVGGTSTFDIGNDVNIKGGVLNTDKIQGIIGGDMNIESLQDTAIYDSDQKNMGFSADLDLAKGTGSSLSVNGGKTNLTADYKAVGEQSGIFANQADIVAEGKGTVKGGVFVTSKEAQANGKSNIVFKQGVSSQDIKNITSYEGEALSIGLSIGNTTGKPQATMNGIGYGTDSDSDSSITKGGVSGYNDPQGILTTDNREALGGKLESVFDANRVNEELGAQTQITQEFGKEAPKAVGDFANNRIKAIIADTTLSNAEKNAAIAKWDEGGVYRVAAHTALGALGTGSVEGALSTGGVAAAAPMLNNLQDKIAESLIASGMSESIAKGTASGVISLALLGAGTAAGLDTSSTVTATNVDANNRQLHPDQIKFLKLHAEDYAKEKGITKEEALKILVRAAVYNLDKGWYDAYNTHLSLDEIKQFDDASKFLEERNGHHIQNTASVESYNRINDPDGVEPNIVDTGVLRGPFRNENPEYYTDSRMYLDEMLTDADAIQFVLDNVALQNPYTYGRTPETAAEVQNAKAEGSNKGAGNLILAPLEFAKEGISKLQNPYGTVIDGFKSIGNGIKAIPSVPEKAKQAYEDFTYIGLEDNLAIMQGKGLDVARNDAESSTKLGIGIGLGGVGAGSIKKLGKADIPSSAKAIPAKQDTINTLLTQTRTNAEGKTTAYSKGAVGDNIIEGSDFDNFTNTAQQVAYPQGSRKTWPNFPGVSNVDGKLVINDSELYLQGIDKIYDGAGTPLNERTRQHIANSINRNNVYAGPNGLPGTHAEVRTYNDITTRYPEVLDTDISIATVQGEIKRKDSTIGKDFPACSNCSSILPNEVYIPTGRAENPNNGSYFRED